MSAFYTLNEVVPWYTGLCKIISVEKKNSEYMYELQHTQYELCCHASETRLMNFQRPTEMYVRRAPNFLIMDHFYENPEEIRAIALEQKYYENPKAFKGKRTRTKFLLPGLKERFEALLGVTITSWLNYETNGIFQITKSTDPIVYHSDLQSYAAAIYMTPNAPVGAGTSFWRDRTYGCRRPPFNELERERFADDKERQAAQNEIYNEYNLLHPDNWELVDKAAALFNRLVIWDAQMIHSASSYEAFAGDTTNEAESSRLVQLFFFDIAQ